MSSDPVLKTLTTTSFSDKQYQVVLALNGERAPQIRLKLFQILSDGTGTELQRTIAIRMRPAVDIARAILAADEECRTARASTSSAEVRA